MSALLLTQYVSLISKTSASVVHSTRFFSTTRCIARSSNQWLERQHRDPYVKAADRLNYRARSAFKLLAIDEKFKIFAPGQIVLDCGAAPGSWSQVAVQRLRGPPEKKAYTVRQLVTGAKIPIGFDESEISDFRCSPDSGFVLGFDLSPISPIKGASFLHKADIYDPSTRDRISQQLLQHRKLVAEAASPNGFSVDETLASAAASLTLPRCVDVVMSDMAPNASGHFSDDVLNLCRLARSAFDLAAVFLKPEGCFVFKLWDSSTTAVIVDQLSSRFSKVRIFKPEGSRDESAEIFIVARGFKLTEKAS